MRSSCLQCKHLVGMLIIWEISSRRGKDRRSFPAQMGGGQLLPGSLSDNKVYLCTMASQLPLVWYCDVSYNLSCQQTQQLRLKPDHSAPDQQFLTTQVPVFTSLLCLAGPSAAALVLQLTHQSLKSQIRTCSCTTEKRHLINSEKYSRYINYYNKKVI